ncbi:hypothetical protein Goklo_007504 [Gossypium klotzschianum]|uniref:Uncharacterized protein n=1 Tax=Gossypium klotzschianum TaxID=34286 RepID=A0A7J8W341_9ROSI|nr:hypothetical protein [Gossypium klotzschianum]
MIPDEILYRCEDFDWVPLLMIWGVFGYDSLLVLRQYRLRQFIPATQGLAQCEFVIITKRRFLKILTHGTKLIK